MLLGLFEVFNSFFLKIFFIIDCCGKSLDGFVAGVDGDREPYSADLHLDYAGSNQSIEHFIAKYYPQMWKGKGLIWL